MLWRPANRKRKLKMRPIDYRNETFAAIQTRLTGDRLRVLEGYRTYGPCSSRELSARLPMSILTVRPRTTELYQLGFLILETDHRPSTVDCGRDSIFRAASNDEASEIFEKTKKEVCANEQMQFNMR